MIWRAKRRHAFSTIIHALRVRNLLASDCFDLGNLENKNRVLFDKFKLKDLVGMVL
jgi:hypothetical protein